MWRGGRKVLLFLVLLSLCLVPVSAQQVSSSDRQLPIYESELNSLLNNMMTLKSLNEKLMLQLGNLEKITKSQSEQLVALSNDLEMLMEKLQNSIQELTTLKEQLMQSKKDLETLQLQLQKAENSYKSLYESFLVYQKEVEKQINKLKAEKATLVVISILGWLGSIVCGGGWLIEHLK